LNNETLLNIIREYRKDALGPDYKTLTSERAEAMDRYHGRPYGNEEPNRSQIVTKDLSETVDWIMPSVMRVFLQSGALVEFTPVGDDDEDKARQETAGVNHVMLKKNDGFFLLYDTFKDSLLLKNCYAKHWHDETEKTTEREYKDLPEDDLVLLVERLKEKWDDLETLWSEEETRNGIKYTSMRVRLTRTEKCNKIEAVPPEEIRISNKCRGSVQDSIFTEHLPVKTRSDLIEMGMDKDWVMDLNAKGTTETREATARDSISDENDDQRSLDKAMEEVEYGEIYIKVDYDDDGIAELRKVYVVDEKIPEGEEWNQPIETVEITGGVTKRVPHRHLGESLNDELDDLALIHTTLMRQLLNNVYNTVNTEYMINERANLDDFLISADAGVKRIEGDEPVQNAVAPVPSQPILDQLIPAIDLINTNKESRTGVNEANTGVDPNALRETSRGAYMENLNRASQKVEMFIRVYAESFLKEASLRIHELMIKYPDKELMIKLNGQYVQIDPEEWEDRDDLTIKVGLGTGSSEEKLMKLELLQRMQKEIVDMGLVGPDESYALFEDMARELGANAVEKYAINPQSPEFKENKQYIQGLAAQQQGQQNPLAEAEQIKAEAQIMVKRAEFELREKEQQTDALLQHQKQEADQALKSQDLLIKERELVLKEQEILLKEKEIAAKLEQARYKTDLEFSAKMATERMKQGASLEEALSAAVPEIARQNDEVMTSIVNSMLDNMNIMRKEDQANFSVITQDFNSQLAEVVGQMNKPKKVIYDENDNPIGVE